MSEQFDLRLNIDADTKALERKLKGLGSNLNLPINIEWNKTKASIETLQSKLKGLANTEADPKVVANLNHKLKVYQAQAKAIDNLEVAIAKANKNLITKSNNLSVAKARLDILQEEIELTRELASTGAVSQSQLKLKESQIKKAESYVESLEKEIEKLKEVSKLQDNVGRLQGQTTQGVTNTSNAIETLTGSTNTATGGLQGLVKGAIGFEIAQEVFSVAIDLVMQFKDAIIESTLTLEKLKTQLDFSVGDGAGKLQELYEQAQQLGLSFNDLASGYATFSAALKGTPLEFKTDEMFGNVSKAVAGLKLSAADTEGVFKALTQMAAKGKISLEEYNGQLGDRLPITSQAGVKALQNLVSKGLVPVKDFNKTVIGSNAELSKSYKVTSKDVLNYISSGKAQSQMFLPELTKAMGKAFKDIPVEGLQQSLNRAKNALMVFAATVGTTLIPVFTDIIDRFTNIIEYFKTNSEGLGDSLKPLMVAGKAIVGVFDIIDVALKSVFGQGVIELIINSLDELAVAALVIFGAPLVAAITSVAVSLAPVLAALGACVLAVKALKFAFTFLFKVLNDITGGKLGKWIQDLVGKINTAIANAKALNTASSEAKTTAQGLGKAFTEAGNGVGEFVANSKGIKEVVDAVQQLQNEIELIDLGELVKTAEIETKLVAGDITIEEAEKGKLENALASSEGRLEKTKALLVEIETQISTTVDAEKLEDLTEQQKEITSQIPQLEIELAQNIKAIREAAFNDQLDQINEASKNFEQTLKDSENKRLDIVRNSSATGSQLESDRIKTTEQNLNKELNLQKTRIEQLKALRETVVIGSEQDKQIIEQISEAESKRSEILKEQSQLIQDQFEITNRRFEAELSGLEVDKAVIDSKAKILDLQIDLWGTQQQLNDAAMDYYGLVESFNSSVITAKIASLQFELDVNKSLEGIDRTRKNEILERLGLTSEIGQNAIELTRKQNIAEEDLIASKRQQLVIEQESERVNIETSKRKIELEKLKLKFLIQTQKIELEIAKTQQEQALAQALNAREVAKASGDSKALAIAELQILQAKQREESLQAQSKSIKAQTEASSKQLEIEAEILKFEEQSLSAKQQQQLFEFELNTLTTQRAKALEIETKLIEEQAQSRELSRRDALLALEYGTDAQKQASATLQLQLELNNIQAEYVRQSEYVADLEASGILNSEEELILTEAKNDLSEIGLSFLETEYQLEEALANEIAQERENALQRQNEILENRKTLLEAELGLQQAQNDLENARLERRLLEIDRKEGLGQIDQEQADEARFKIERQQLELEQEMLIKQQESDLKRLEIEQQIEIMRLRATQAEAEVVRARAEATLAESKGALSRAVESGNQDAIDAAEGAIEASEKGVEAATDQIELLDDQIEQTLELQKIQLETIETQQKADQERLNNRERELEIAREIAEYEERQARQAAEEAGFGNTGNRVSGGGVSAGRTYIVGEQGTELFQGVDGSKRLLGVKGQHAFTPNVPGKILSNQTLEQVIAANVMRSDEAVVNAIQRGFKTSGSEFSRLAGVLVNRTNKPVVVNNYGSKGSPSIDLNRLKLSRL